MGAVSLLAISFNLDFVASLINFGALIAFTFVNLTVIVYFAYRRREINGPGRSSPTSCAAVDRHGVDDRAVDLPVGGVDAVRHHLVHHRNRRAAVDHEVLPPPLTINMGEAHS